ncbi:hypothetical protein [Salinicola socius]|uniref:Glycosyl transferase family 2 n=1 Tax=Salinicola socius TaxID=404433 RepID=A0A1Q8SQD0_9GAMM|nr:hypothetical protein [Salinicola socius]OLO03619.1 hypothetical protein BTW07_13600 [Salinicola socius]
MTADSKRAAFRATPDICFTALIMVRGESDIVWSSLLHHARLGFHRLIVISYLDHDFLRQCIDKLRDDFPGMEVDLVELESQGHFGRRKAFYVNRALSLFIDPKMENYVYCFDADEFLSLGIYPSIGTFFAAFTAGLASGAHDGTVGDCFPLPWLNLIPQRHQYDERDLGGQFLEGDYLCVDTRQNSRHKVLFRKRPGTRVHMAYHQAYAGEKDVPMLPDSETLAFVEASGACVYHVPLRSLSQFRDRLEGPMRRVMSQSGVNPAPAHAELPFDIADALFSACTASQPRFASLAEAADVFGEAITDRKIRAITRFIYRHRVNVGPVLSPRNSR